MPEDDPEIGSQVIAAGIRTNFHDAGEGEPVLLIHGSGPGVSAWANWRGTIPGLAPHFRVLAPDVVGFGYTERPEGVEYRRPLWEGHMIGFLDALGIERASIVGNSFGGAIAAALAVAHPDRVHKLVLMGSSAATFPLTPGLDEVWGLEPTLDAMRRALDLFAWDRGLVTDELAEVRLRAYTRDDVAESYLAMFPPPRQRWIDHLASDPEDLKRLTHPTLVIHGRDDQVVPVSASLDAFSYIPRAQLHVFGQCGHWTQIERARVFVRLVRDFLSDDDA